MLRETLSFDADALAAAEEASMYAQALPPHARQTVVVVARGGEAIAWLIDDASMSCWGGCNEEENN